MPESQPSLTPWWLLGRDQVDLYGLCFLVLALAVAQYAGLQAFQVCWLRARRTTVLFVD